MEAPAAAIVDVEPVPPLVLGRRAVTPQTEARAEAQLQQMMIVSCYTRFDNLAHGPKGTEAKQSLYTFYMDPNDGQMVLLSVTQEAVMNPAFLRVHPRLNVLYGCTESVAEHGQIVSWSVCPRSGKLSKLSSAGAGGTSTCYLTLDRECKNMLVVNYWNATIGVFGISGADGSALQLRSIYDPNEGRSMKARHEQHVNHSQNDDEARREGQCDPHSHAVILDPYFGRVAYVPDLGMDIVRQFRYDETEGVLQAAGQLKSGPEDRNPLGPRYIEFHPSSPVCYVVNELSSEVSVFQFDREAAETLLKLPEEELPRAMPTLRLVQTLRTIPEGFDGELNTCGRVAVHPSGRFLLVSNRGHDSIAVFSVHGEGLLTLADMQHTRGATPRHFQFDGSGQWMVTANQDSDSLSVFRLNLATGRLEWTGHEYSVPSPNFVCSVAPQRSPVRTCSPAGRRAPPAGSQLSRL